MTPLAIPVTAWLLVMLVTAPTAAQPKTLDNVPIDPDAELIVVMADDTVNMDPRIGMGFIRSAYIRQVFESLVDVDPQGKPLPGLALSWKSVGDTAWEFTLRKGVKFHDGEPLNADTLLFNLDRMFRKNLDKHPVKDVAAANAFDRTFPFVSKWEKVDDYTVRVHTSEPSPNLWDFIGREPLVPKAYTIKNGVETLNEKPVGTGAWKLVEWRRKTHMILERNEDYWGVSGWYRGWLDDLLMRLGDVQLAFPVLVLAVAVLAVLGASLGNLIVVLGVTGWITYARIVRGEVLTLRERDFVAAARALGAHDSWILRRHLLPNVLPPITVVATFSVARTIIAEASLSFLGLGIPAPQPSWGAMLDERRNYITTGWWLALFPGLAILLLVLGINLVGDWLRDVLDPRMERGV
jgi:ABC-type methionine transport system permease subunit